MTRSIIFDLDHTLLYAKGLEESWFMTCEIYGLRRKIAKKIWYESKGLHLWAQLEKAGIRELSKQNIIVNNFWDSYFKKAKPILLPTVKETIKELYHLNIKLYISTGSQTLVAKHFLKELELLDYFELVLGSELTSLKGLKHYEIIIDHLDNPDDFGLKEIAVGDGQLDMVYAKQFKINTRLGIKNSNLKEFGATNIINEISEVLNYI